MTSPWRQPAFAALNDRCRRYRWFDPTTAQEANKEESDRLAQATVASHKKEPLVVRPIPLKSPNGFCRTLDWNDA